MSMLISLNPHDAWFGVMVRSEEKFTKTEEAVWETLREIALIASLLEVVVHIFCPGSEFTEKTNEYC